MDNQRIELLNMAFAAEIEEGAYEARIKEFKEINDGVHKPYIAVKLEIDGQIIEDRWYESRFEYIFPALRRQFGRQFENLSAADIIDLATKDDFCVTIEYSAEYGRQISYSAS